MHRLAALRFIAVAACLSVPLTAAAQAAENGPIDPGAPSAPPAGRHALGLELSFLVPRGDFAPGSEISVGYGVRGAVGLGPRGMLDIGAAFRSIAHDSHTAADTEVKNMLRTLGLSGRVALPFRFARPYVGASVGAAYFGTETWVERWSDDEGEYQWELEDLDMVNLQPIASTRVGLLVDLTGGRNTPVLSLDLGLEDHYGGEARYQVGGRGDVRRTGTSYRVFSLGVTLRSR